MPAMTLTGIIRAYTPTDDGQISLGIEESNPSETARMAVRDLVKDFNPNSGNHGYGAKDAPCTVKPGFALYRVTVPGNRTDLNVGASVEVALEVVNLRKVKFYNRKWGAISELRYELAGIRVLGEPAAAGAGREKK